VHGLHNRLGFALMLGYLHYPGRPEAARAAHCKALAL
jgi:hypothetical protein